MEALKASSFPSLHIRTTLNKTQYRRPMFFNFHSNPIPSSSSSLVNKNQSKFKVSTTLSSTVSTEPTNPPEPALETQSQDEKFDWYSQWYPLMPVCDLDKRKPHAKKVLGLDVVVWWDRNESAWKVFDDSCPHRLAPLSEGRIDQWGRLQCVYHGWCFNGSGNCKLIPQAPPDGPPVITLEFKSPVFKNLGSTFCKCFCMCCDSLYLDRILATYEWKNWYLLYFIQC
jgi:nitrite reductase/ring-hydroxylating ferredoxin subunit